MFGKKNKKQDIKVNSVIKALVRTRNEFKKFWDDPKLMEKEIFYQFLIMQTFRQLNLPKSLLDDFWYTINTKLVIKVGKDIFDENL